MHCYIIVTINFTITITILKIANTLQILCPNPILKTYHLIFCCISLHCFCLAHRIVNTWIKSSCNKNFIIQESTKSEKTYRCDWFYQIQGQLVDHYLTKTNMLLRVNCIQFQSGIRICHGNLDKYMLNIVRLNWV